MAALLFLICLTFVSIANAGNFYKWTDENGEVHISDHMPQSAVNSDRHTLNEQGRVISTEEAAKNPEEYSALRKAEQERQEKLNQKRLDDAAIHRRDQALLLTFSSEEELSRAKDERIEVLDSVIQLIYKSTSISQKKLAELENLAEENYISKDLAVPGGLAQKIEVITRKNFNRDKQLRQKLKERNRIETNYELDLARYRELRPAN